MSPFWAHVVWDNNADEKGTRVLYETVAEAVCRVRDCGGIRPNWNEDINLYYLSYGKRRNKNA